MHPLNETEVISQNSAVALAKSVAMRHVEFISSSSPLIGVLILQLILGYLDDLDVFLFYPATRTAILHIFLSLISLNRTFALVPRLDALRRAAELVQFPFFLTFTSIAVD